MDQLPPGAFVQSLVAVLTVMGGGAAWLVKLLRDQATTQRDHERDMADRYAAQGERYNAALRETIDRLQDKLLDALGGVCQARECTHRRPLDVRRDDS